MSRKNTPLVTVLLPCYNAEAYLKESINSILNQSYQNLELILIDDGSVDSSSEIYTAISELDNRLKIYKNECNLGLIKTLNLGIDHAKGEFIARMDADDISDSDRIRLQLEFLKKNLDVAVVGTEAKIIDFKGTILKKRTKTFFEKNTLRLSSYLTQPLFHGSIMARKAILSKNKYDNQYQHSEDFELWLRIISKGYAIANISEIGYYYRINLGGVSHSKTVDQVKSHNNASRKYLELLLGRELDLHHVSILNNRPLKMVDVSDYRQTMKIFEELKLKIKADNTKELKDYLIVQKNNILIQAIKSAKNYRAKLYFISNLISRLRYTTSWKHFIKI